MGDNQFKLMEILEMLNEMYPNITQVLINDEYNPSSIMFVSEEKLNEVAREMNVADMIDDFDIKKCNGNNGNDGGFFH